MRDEPCAFEFYGLAFETPRVIFHLWSPWRATALEHRLFEAVRLLPRTELEEAPDERRLLIPTPRPAGWRSGPLPRAQGLAGGGRPRQRTPRLALAAGGRHRRRRLRPQRRAGQLWGFLRLGLDRGGLGEPEKGEDIDLDGFGLEITAEGAAR